MQKLFSIAVIYALALSAVSLMANPQPMITTKLIETFPIEMHELIEYPVYINAWMEDEPGEDIDRVEVTVDGEAVTVKEGSGFYYFLFRPDAYGDHTIEMTAYGTNGASNAISRSVSVTDDISNQTVRALDDVVIEFGGENSRWYEGTYELPQYIGTYEQVIADFIVECPSIAGGCDDWDRLAWVEIKGPDGEWVELIRYITPYGRGCNHSANVTPLNSLLQGAVEFRVFIDTWGTGGWKLTLDLEHRKGFPANPYTRVDKVWDASYDFGNPANLQPVPVVNFELPVNANVSRLYLTNTGHGWGANNSFNAAEFFHATHDLRIDGINTFEHDQWWDCDPNPDGCSPQSGTWQYDRAGWCPGAIATPETYDFTGYIGNGDYDLSYIFMESYVDNCHANNPSCVSGVTCNDCNDGYNPIYYVDAVIISYSDVPLLSDDYAAPPPLPTGIFDHYDMEYALRAYPNPSGGRFRLETPDDIGDSARIRVVSVDGAQHKFYYFNSAAEIAAFDFDLSSLAPGNYFLQLETRDGSGAVEITLE